MKQKIIYIAIAISIICNFVFFTIILVDRLKGADIISSKNKTIKDQLEDPQIRQQTAEAAIRKLVCDNLYYPASYDPVLTNVDSAFFCTMLDGNYVQAAYEIIQLKEKYQSAKKKYDEADWTIRFHGNPSGPFLERERKERKDNLEIMSDLKIKITEKEAYIKSRDNSRDGNFIGWWVYHRFRASNGEGNVSFSNKGILLDKDMKQCLLNFDLDEYNKYNFQSLKKVIDSLQLSNVNNN